MINQDNKDNPRVTDEVVYMTADEEDNYHVAQANEKLDEDGHFVRNSVSGRYREETQEYDKDCIRLHGRISKDGVLRCYSTDSVPAER